MPSNRNIELNANNLTVNATPNTAADYVLFYDASAGKAYKVLITDIGYLDIPVGDPLEWRMYKDRTNWDYYTANVGSGNTSTGFTEGACVLFTTGAVSGDYEIMYRRIIVEGASGNSAAFSDFAAGQSVVYEFVMATIDTTDVTVRCGFGENAQIASADASSVTQAKFRIINTQAAVVHSDGTGAVTATNITVNNQTDFHTYRIEWIPGTSVIFSVDGTVVSTATTNIPLTSDTGNIRFALGIETNATASKQCKYDMDPVIYTKKA
jgi:hypothetical protein